MLERISVSLFVLALGLSFPLSSPAQQDDSAANSLRSDLTIEQIDKRANNAKSVSDLDDANKSEIQQLYETARQQIQAWQKATQELLRFQKILRKPNQRSEVEDELAVAEAFQVGKIAENTPEKELKDELRNINSDLSEAREVAVTSSTEADRRQKVLTEIPQRIAGAELKLADVIEQLDSAAPTGESPVFTQARVTKFLSEKQNLEAQLLLYPAQKSSYEITSDLLPIRAKRDEQRVKNLVAKAAAYQNRISEIRKDVIQLFVDRARAVAVAAEKAAEAAVNDEALQGLKIIADDNLKLASDLQNTSSKIVEVKQVVQKIESSHATMFEQFETAKSRVEAISLNDTIGIMLRKNKSDVELKKRLYRVDSSLEEQVFEIRANEFLSQDQTKVLDDMDSAVASFASEIPGKTDKNALRALLVDKKQILSKLAELQNAHFNSLLEKLDKQETFAKLCQQYTTFIDEHVLWIRSAKMIGKNDVSGAMAASNALIERNKWEAVWNSLYRSATNRLHMFLFVVCGLVLLFTFQPRLRRNINKASEKTFKRSCREFTPSATTLLETFLISWVWTGSLMTFGWLLRSDIHAIPFASALGTGLIAVGLAAALLEFLRQVCRENGLAHAHFGWTDSARRTIRTNLHWLICIGGPLMLVAVTLRHIGNEEWNNSLGRLATIGLLLLSLVFVYQVFRPGGPLFLNHENRDSNFYRLRYLRFSVFTVGHAVLIIFAIAGYYYTTYQLGTNLIHSLSLVICAVTLYAISLRFLLVRRRRLRFDQLIEQRRKQQKLAAQSTADAPAVQTVAEAMEIEVQEQIGTDINSVTRQAKELTGVIFFFVCGAILWHIWQDVLPATKFLEKVQLWSVAIEGSIEVVTLRDLLISLGLFLLTFFAVRNIPGMLELVLLKRLPLDAGSRYAITTIFRYVLTVVGVILALNFLKIPWAKYSWLVAAISVGLGFGLQEIVANFVSGLIILLERPVRVGDVVTIDGTTGVVSRIQMRATTVTNWDNQELVVPNKDLITGKLMNWTLSSVMNRVSLKVGVAYGSDIDQVHQLILNVAKENDHVLNEPVPLVTFEEFGDSSLNFTLRCCITAIEKRFVIVHQLNKGMNDALNEAAIEIPFPQRDVHMIAPPE